MSASVWRIRYLGTVASMHARIGWQNLRTTEFLDSGDYYLITGTDFEDGHVNFDTCHYVEKKRFAQDINIQLQVGSILITKDGTLGKVAYIDKLNKPATLNAGVFNVIVRDSQTNEKYLFHLLKSPALMNYATIKSTGGTIKHLNQNVLVKFPVVLPKDIQEQKHISEILSTCDTVIQNTQKTIDKYKAIKQGMMQDLFTRGLTKNGKLRPSYKDAPELYKESELGMIPKEWTETPVIDIGEVISGGTPSTKNTDFWDGNIPFVTPNDLSVNEGAYITSTERYITVLGLSKSSAIELPEGTLIISSRAPIGYLAIASFNCVTNQGCKSVVFDSKQDPLFHYYNFQRYVNKMKSLGSGTTFAEISKKDVEKLKVSYPLKDEQIAIAKRLSSIDSAIQKEETILAKYKKIRTGLMTRLLTPPEDAEIIDETGE